jgi:hypothetical protein
MDRATASEKKGSEHNTQHDDWSMHRTVPSFSPELAIETVEIKPPSVDVRLLDLLGPYTSMRSLAPPPWGPTANVLQLSGSSSQTSGNTSQGALWEGRFLVKKSGPCAAKDLER